MRAELTSLNHCAVPFFKTCRRQLVLVLLYIKHHLFQFITPSENAPSGMIARGEYKAHCKFLDDDKTKWLEWDWAFNIKKDW